MTKQQRRRCPRKANNDVRRAKHSSGPSAASTPIATREWHTVGICEGAHQQRGHEEPCDGPGSEGDGHEEPAQACHQRQGAHAEVELGAVVQLVLEQQRDGRGLRAGEENVCVCWLPLQGKEAVTGAHTAENREQYRDDGGVATGEGHHTLRKMTRGYGLARSRRLHDSAAAYMRIKSMMAWI